MLVNRVSPAPRSFDFFRPAEQILCRFRRDRRGETFAFALPRLLGIDGYDAPGRRNVGDLVDQLRLYGRPPELIDTLCAGVRQSFHIAQFADASAYGERDVDAGDLVRPVR